MQPPLPTEVVLPEVTGAPESCPVPGSFTGPPPLPDIVDLTVPIQNLRMVERAENYIGHTVRSLGAGGGMTGMAPLSLETNQCSNFVSAVLVREGLRDRPETWAPHLENWVQQNGWTQVPQADAMPGDIYFSNWSDVSQDHGHVELVRTVGGTETIGANTDDRGAGHQSVLTRNTPSGGTFYSRWPTSVYRSQQR